MRRNLREVGIRFFYQRRCSTRCPPREGPQRAIYAGSIDYPCVYRRAIAQPAAIAKQASTSEIAIDRYMTRPAKDARKHVLHDPPRVVTALGTQYVDQ